MTSEDNPVEAMVSEGAPAAPEVEPERPEWGPAADGPAEEPERPPGPAYPGKDSFYSGSKLGGQLAAYRAALGVEPSGTERDGGPVDLPEDYREDDRVATLRAFAAPYPTQEQWDGLFGNNNPEGPVAGAAAAEEGKR